MWVKTLVNLSIDTVHMNTEKNQSSSDKIEAVYTESRRLQHVLTDVMV